MAGTRFWRRGSHAVDKWPLTVLAFAAAGGFLFVTAAVNADGDDLRPSGGDIASLLAERGDRIDRRRDDARDLRTQIDDLSSSAPGSTIDKLRQAAQALEPRTGLTEASGEGVRVELSDAPRSAQKPGLDPNLLVVHEQDIQAYVNALWAGGATAVSLQGQRLISTTGIKCVGNTVLLDGVPYSPPYRIVAIGDVGNLIDSIRNTPQTVTYADYSRRLGIGLKVETLVDAKVPAYAGNVSLRYATAVDQPPS